MSTLSLPTGIIANACEWLLKSNTQQFTSELNGSVQTVALPGDKWTASLTFSNRTGREARQIYTFVASLRGRSGRFYLTPHDHYEPAGPAGGTPLVKGALQTGTTLLIDGCTPSITNWLEVGDFFQIGNELKMLTADASTNVAGETTLHFVPPLRTSPADNSAIITSNPTCIMALADDNQARRSASPWNPGEPLYALSLACEECLDI